MIIRRLELRQFGPHAHLMQEFSPHMNAIVGRNGSGKSHLPQALAYLLTGDLAGETLDDVARNQRGPERSTVSGTLTHAGWHIEIDRGVKPSSCQMRLSNGDPVAPIVIDGAKAVTKRLLDILETTEDRLADYVFVRQGEIASWLNKTTGKRVEELGRFFSLDRYQKVWKGLGNKINSTTVPTPGESLESVQNLLRNEQATLMQLQQQEAQLRQSEPQKTFELIFTALEADRLLREWQDKHDTCTAAVTAAKIEVDRYTAEVERLQAEKLTYDTALSAIEPDRQRAQAAQAAWDRQAQVEIAKQRYQSHVQQVKAAFRKRLAVVRRQPALSSEQQASLSDWTRERQVAERDHAALSGASKTCPTCGQTMPKAEENARRLAELGQRIEALRASMAPLLQQQMTHGSAEAARPRCLALRQAIKHNAQLARQMESSAADTAPPEMSREEISRIQQEASVISDAAGDVFQALIASQQYLAGAKATFAAKGGELEQLEAQQPPGSLLDAATKQGLLARREQAHRDSEALEALELASALSRQRAEQLLERCNRVEAVLRQQRQAQAMLTHLGHLRELYQWLPRAITTARLSKAQAGVNEFLGLFQAPFRVQLADDLRLQLHYTDGAVLTDKLMSPGQRTTLGWAIRLALNTTFVGHLGLLSLDEPTEWLDSFHMSQLGPVLARLHEISVACQLQVLFITHQPTLLSIFDKVIDLDGLSRPSRAEVLAR